MKRVRCPACGQLHDAPPAAFDCAKCGRHLRWTGVWLSHVRQLALFDAPGWQQSELPLLVLPSSPTTARAGGSASPSVPEALQQPPQAPGRVGDPFHDAMGLIFGCRAARDGGDDVVPAIAATTAGRTEEELVALAFMCAGIAAHLTDWVDNATGGLATEFLREWALAVARLDDPGDGAT